MYIFYFYTRIHINTTLFLQALEAEDSLITSLSLSASALRFLLSTGMNAYITRPRAVSVLSMFSIVQCKKHVDEYSN